MKRNLHRMHAYAGVRAWDVGWKVCCVRRIYLLACAWPRVVAVGRFTRSCNGHDTHMRHAIGGTGL